MTPPSHFHLGPNTLGEARPRSDRGRDGGNAPPYAELCVTSNFTFLTGASHPEELVARALALEYGGLAITDECSFAGSVRAHLELKDLRESDAPARAFRLIHGTEIQLVEGEGRKAAPGAKLVLLAQTRAGYGNLSQLVTLARRQAGTDDAQPMAARVPAQRGGQIFELHEAGDQLQPGHFRAHRRQKWAKARGGEILEHGQSQGLPREPRWIGQSRQCRNRLLGLGQPVLPKARRHQPPTRAAQKQGLAQMRLKLPQGHRQRGLADMQRRCRRTHPAMGAHGHGIFDLAQGKR